MPRTRFQNTTLLMAIILLLGVFHSALSQSLPQSRYFSNWPTGREPDIIGTQVARHFVTSPHMDSRPIIYPEFCAWYGALRFADAAGDKELAKQLIDRFQSMLASTDSGLIPRKNHVDHSVFGILPLQIYLMTHEKKYLTMGLFYADRQWNTSTKDGLSPETRFWIDDMYMITILQVQAYRATGDLKYLDRASLEMCAYLNRLQRPNGLFFHGEDVPIYWSRGNGWVAAGMTELLMSLPINHPRRPQILAAYRTMMKALLDYQGADGMWRQLIDDNSAWPEASGSAMFTFALVEGVRRDWLDSTIYGPHAQEAWIALSGYVDQNWDVTNVCEGTDKFNNRQFYLLRKRKTGDFHGQAPLLWAAAALLP